MRKTFYRIAALSLFLVILTSRLNAFAEEMNTIEESSLHAASAVLMDASSGRILY